MSVVAWDGKIIAADCNLSNDDLCFIGTKLVVTSQKKKEFIVGWTGAQATGLVLLQWFRQGEHKDAFPYGMQGKNDWCRLIVLGKDGLYVYERFPVKLWLHPSNLFMAWGSGRDFAIGAMAHGANAEEAVEITNTHCASCGQGVTSFARDMLWGR